MGLSSAQRAIDTYLIVNQLVTDGATVTANLDCADASWATIRVLLGTEEGTDATANVISLLTGETTDATNFTTATANLAEDLETGREVRYEVDLRGKARYLRLSVTAGTETASDIEVAAVASLTKNVVGPASTTAMGANTVVIV